MEARGKETPREAGQRPSGVVLTAGLFAMTMAGSTYWAPSLATVLAGPLSLPPSSSAAFSASVNAGYVASIFPGLIHARLGPRRTAAAGSAALSATYLSIAGVVYLRPSNPLVFLIPLACASLPAPSALAVLSESLC
jgi:hypothetical protein